MKKLIIYGVIYKIRNKINNKIYIGQTINTFDRRYENNLEKYTHNEHLKRSIHKYGIKNFEIDKEFDIAYSKEELDKLEDMYIKIYKTTNIEYGYNKKEGGSNGRPTEETKRKLSEAKKGSIPWNKGRNNIYNEKTLKLFSKIRKGKNMGKDNSFYGKTHTKETRKIIAEKATGRIVSEETKKKLSLIHKGRVCSQESILKRIETRKKNYIKEESYWYGRTGIEHPNSKQIICITTEKLFGSTREAGRYYNCHHSNISKCCKGKSKYCGKLEDDTPLIWRYIKDLTLEEYIKYDIENKLKELYNQELVQAC